MISDRTLHLYRRAGFGLSPEEYQHQAGRRVGQAWSALLADARQAPALPEPAPPDLAAFRSDRSAFFREQIRAVYRQGAAWLRRMAAPDHPALLERMCLFWHGHFACRSRFELLAVKQLNALRQHALGPFRDLLLAMARDPSMIRFLNNQQNRKQQPNENFARELMELFTLGRGHYAEGDVQAAARAFTGWSSTPRGEFAFRRQWHDYGEKTFFGQQGPFDGSDIIDLILERRQTARFLTGKIYRYFVGAEPEEAHLRELAELLYRTDYDIGRLMEAIFTADWFYAPDLRGARIKSPVELVAGISRQLHIEWKEDTALFLLQRALGQELFNPPNVAGWPQGRGWIDNNTLSLRLNLATFLLGKGAMKWPARFGPEERRPEITPEQLRGQVWLEGLARWVGKEDPAQQYEALARFFLPRLPEHRRPAGLEVRTTNSASTLERQCLYLLSLPEYQVC